ncbi:unnamed protein product [Musa textilis]
MEEAIKVVHKLLARGCLPDSVTCSAVINGFCHTEDRLGKKNAEAHVKEWLQAHYCHIQLPC